MVGIRPTGHLTSALSRFTLRASRGLCGAVMVLFSITVWSQTLDDCKAVPKHTAKPPYTLACSGKSECAATDTLTVTAASG